MNVITYNKAYCLYPRATLLDSTGIILKSVNEAVRAAVDKYRRRGFTLVRVIGRGDQSSITYHKDKVRVIRDGHTWTIDLPRINFDMEAVNRADPVSVTTWSMATFPGDFHRIHFRLVDDEPSVAPLVVATKELKDLIGTICIRAAASGLFEEDERTVTGSNRYAIINRIILALLTSIIYSETLKQ